MHHVEMLKIVTIMYKLDFASMRNTHQSSGNIAQFTQNVQCLMNNIHREDKVIVELQTEMCQCKELHLQPWSSSYLSKTI